MKKVIKAAIFLGIWLSFAGSFGGAQGAMAQVQLDPIQGLDSGYQKINLGDPMSALTIMEKIISNVIGFITVAAGVTFVVYIVLAGLTWITAREESERISKSKQMLMNALVGLAIIAASWALTGVLETVFGFTILHPAELIYNMIP